MDERRVVQVIAHGAGGEVRLGSGYLAAGRTVLTAAHVVDGAHSVMVRRVLEPGRLGAAEAQVAWIDLDGPTDLAVLRVAADEEHDAVFPVDLPPIRFGRVTEAVACEAIGFPLFKMRSPASGPAFRDTHHAHGRTTPWSDQYSGTLEITVEPPREDLNPRISPWAGMSGAAVFSDAVLIGVVSEHHRPEGPNRITARPVTSWYNLDPTSLKALQALVSLPERDGLLPRGAAESSASFVVRGGSGGGIVPALFSAVDPAVRELAMQVYAQWRDEAGMRELFATDPIPVPWREEPRLSDHPTWVGAVTDSSTQGLNALVDAFLALTHRRLIILGDPGSGKTTLAVLLLLRLFECIDLSGPIPVLFSLASWNPFLEHLDSWLEHQLLRDYPKLPANQVHALISARRILLVLDGLDELPPAHQPHALTMLNQVLADGRPVIVTCRTKEYLEVIKGKGVVGAAVIQARSVPPDAIVNYLCSSPQDLPRWKPLLDAIHAAQPTAPLVKALSTPLLLWLTRVVYNGDNSDPADLVDPQRFPDLTAIEQHLLDALIPAVYPSRPPSPRQKHTWDSNQVQQWLSCLAQYMDRFNTRDLAWWRLSDDLRRRSRFFTIIATSALVTILADWLVYLPIYFQSGVRFGMEGALLDTLSGPIVGVGVTLIYILVTARGRTGFEPSRVQIQFRGRQVRSWSERVRTFASRFTAGLTGGFLIGLLYKLFLTVSQILLFGSSASNFAVFIDNVVFFGIELGLLFGAGIGLVFGLASVLETTLDPRTAVSPTGLLRANRTSVIRQVLFLAPLTALAIGFGGLLLTDILRTRLITGSLQRLLGLPVLFSWRLSGGLLLGAVGGLAVALSYALVFTAWGQWIVLTRIWWPRQGRLPWSITRFLDDAHKRGLLRQNGAVYQFRHTQLHNYFANCESNKRT